MASGLAERFNPRPVFKPGVTAHGREVVAERLVSIRARFLSRALRCGPVLARVALGVSIRARFLSRALPKVEKVRAAAGVFQSAPGF